MKAQRKERDPKVSIKKIKTTLTKAQMIASIQQQEAAAFLECKKSEMTYGAESALHVSDRTRWCAIIRLMESLGIETDYALPDNVEALAMIQERVARHKAQA